MEDTTATQTQVSDSAADAEDRALMRAVADGRDRKAFAQIFERHQRDAYNLARHLTRTREAAEDAVQEAMLRAWSSAATFRTDGSVRSWLLRIVAREAVRAYRRTSAESRRIERNNAGAPAAAEAAQAAAAENREELAALRTAVARLPEKQRALLALYFGAELSQSEIGKQLEMQQTTVSRAIHDLLAQLRGHLDRAGFAAAAPLLSAELLREALLGSEAPPAGLADAVARCIAHAGSAQSGKAAAAGAANTSRAVFAAALVAIAAGGWWWASQPSSESETVAAPAAASEDAAAAPIVKDAPIDYRWTFDGKLPPEIDAAADGVLEFVKGGRRKKTALFLPAKSTSGFAIDVTLQDRPVVLRMNVEPKNVREAVSMSFLLFESNKAQPATVWLAGEKALAETGAMEYRFYLRGDWGFAYAGEKIRGVSHYLRDVKGGYLCFSGSNLLVYSMEMREIDASELPPEMNDPDAFVKSMRLVTRPEPDEKQILKDLNQ